MTQPEQFHAFYQAELLPHLEQLEARRRQIIARLGRAALLSAGVTLALGVVTAALAREPLLGLLALIAGLVLFVVMYFRITRGYVQAFKESIIGRIVRFIDPNLQYQPGSYIPMSVYMDSQIFQTHPDRYNGEDMVWGMVGQTAVQFSEIHSEYRTETTDNKGRRRVQWHTIFKGIFFIADFNKHFRGRTVVLPDVAERLFGRLGQALQSWNIARADLVRLEDPEFEKRFVVYADDQVEARYLLSPSLMARIVGYQDRTGRQVHLSFVRSNLNVAIASTKDMFEPKLFSSVLGMDLAREYLDDLMLAVSIVEDLNLNTRIWTKE